jgi:hypothetical protein
MESFAAQYPGYFYFMKHQEKFEPLIPVGIMVDMWHSG